MEPPPADRQVRTRRTYPSGYEIGGGEGSGQLPLSWAWVREWAADRIGVAGNYWPVAVWPDGRPRAMPVWRVWDEGVVTTEDAADPAVIEGNAEVIIDMKTIKRFRGLSNEKCQTSYTVDFLGPALNATVRFSHGGESGFVMLRHGDFSGSPTRWVFDDGAGSIPAAWTLE